MTPHNKHISTSQAAVAEINRSIDAVTAEIAARTDDDNDAATTKRNRRFISAKTATLSEAADIARAAARRLTDARTRILDEVARAEAAGFALQQDFSVSDPMSPDAPSVRAHRHATATQAAVTNFVALDRRVSKRLQSAANALKDFHDN